jgi:hypothetical protein
MSNTLIFPLESWLMNINKLLPLLNCNVSSWTCVGSELLLDDLSFFIS